MCDEAKLALVRQMTGMSNDDVDWSDDTLKAYISLAEQKILNKAFPYGDSSESIPDKYDFLQCEIAVYLLNKRGAEGQTAHSENGISRSYENADIPDSMLNEVVPYCGVIR